MLDRLKERNRYILANWTAEKRPSGWFIARSAYGDARHDWKGPYTSIASASLMVARELGKELKRRIPS